MAIKNSLPQDVVAKLSAQLEYTYQRVADAKTELLVKKGVQPLERALENAIASGNDFMANTIRDRIEGFSIDPVAARTVTDLDIAKAYIDTLITARPVANFFGGDIMEPVFRWLYNPVDWNVNNFGNQFAPGLYSCVMIWLILSLICYIVLFAHRQVIGFIQLAAISMQQRRMECRPTR